MNGERVWITNYAGHDYKSAEKYGEFKYITRGYVSFQSLDRVKYQIAETLKDSQKDDWLLISGRPLISILASFIWFYMHKQVKLLSWDQKTNKYRELIITEDNLLQMFETIQGVELGNG